ncbi:Uncharacterized protein Adt_02422 [Abeliophyllum distichum]|uniref:Uncharacterized protein n=1 Tax=Abeliophyllum distichum TaxID=126358 RepID=A0ABD1VVL8_9LAMI
MGTMPPKLKEPPAKKGKKKVTSLSNQRRQVEEHVDDGGIQKFLCIEKENIYNKWQMKKNFGRKGGKPLLAYPLLVKQFIANFNHAIEEPGADRRYTTWVCGKWIKFSHAVIENYYGLTTNDIEHISVELDMALVTQFLYGRADTWPIVGPKFLHN